MDIQLHTLTLTILIGIVLVLRQVFRGKVKAIAIYAMWLVVVCKLLIPTPLFEIPIPMVNMPVLPVAEEVKEEKMAEENVTVAQEEDKVVYDVTEEKSTDVGLQKDEYDAVEVEDSIQKEASEEAATAAEKTAWQWLGSAAAKVFPILWAVVAGLLFVVIMAMNGYCQFSIRKDREAIFTEKVPHIYQTDEVNVPCLYGIFRPAIYLTREAAQRDEEEREYIILHEKMHYKQGDHIWALVRILVVCVYWFHPLVWIALKLSKQDAEYAADEGVVQRLTEEERIGYGKTILATLRREARAKRVLTLASSACMSKSEIKKRIVYIAKEKSHSVAALTVLVVAIFVLAIGSFSGKSKVVQNVSDGEETVASKEEEISEPEKLTVLGAELEAAVSKSITDKCTTYMMTSSSWAYVYLQQQNMVESHGVLAKEESENEVTVYVVTQWDCYGIGTYEDDREEFYGPRGGYTEFCTITYEKKNGEYVEKAFWRESSQEGTVRERFPESVEDEELDIARYEAYLTAENRKKGLDYAKTLEEAGTKKEANVKRKMDKVDEVRVQSYDMSKPVTVKDGDYVKKLRKAWNRMELVPVSNLSENNMDVENMLQIDFVAEDKVQHQIMLGANRVCWVDGVAKAFMLDSDYFDFATLLSLVGKSQEDIYLGSMFSPEQMVDYEQDIALFEQIRSDSEAISKDIVKQRAKVLSRRTGQTVYETYHNEFMTYEAMKRWYQKAKEQDVCYTKEEADTYVEWLQQELKNYEKGADALETYCGEMNISKEQYWNFRRQMYLVQFPAQKYMNKTGLSWEAVLEELNK